MYHAAVQSSWPIPQLTPGYRSHRHGNRRGTQRRWWEGLPCRTGPAPSGSRRPIARGLWECGVSDVIVQNTGGNRHSAIKMVHTEHRGIPTSETEVKTHWTCMFIHFLNTLDVSSKVFSIAFIAPWVLIAKAHILPGIVQIHISESRVLSL